MGTYHVRKRTVRAVEQDLIRHHGMGKRSLKPGLLALVLSLGGLLTWACNAHAQETCTAWTETGPQATGPMLGSRVYLPGQALSSDLALFCGDSEEPAWFDACWQVRGGVVCVGVSP